MGRKQGPLVDAGRGRRDESEMMQGQDEERLVPGIRVAEYR